MNVYLLDKTGTYADSRSRLAGAKVMLDQEGIKLSLPIYDENSDPELIIAEVREHFFGWDDVLSHAEDHGFILISAEQQPDPIFTVEQLITTTYASKINPREYGATRLRLALIMTPAKSSSVEDITVLLFDDGQIDLTDIQSDGVVPNGQRVRAANSISIDAPDSAPAGAVISLQVEQPVADTTIYLESTAGTLNRSRLTSSGTVLLNTEGLSPGDVIKIKAGYKYWTGDCELLISLT
jgi:hypothetical protein